MTSPTDLVGLLAVLGAVFVLLGSLGIVKLSSYLLRLHAATKASTLGVGAILLASALHFSAREGGASLIEVLAAILLFATVPVSAQMLARAALHMHPHLGPPPPDGKSRQTEPGDDGERSQAMGTRRRSAGSEGQSTPYP
ncbi:MAG TPA: Na+/H+ antiporter subunit G [Gammaproteobacteria bacterium]|nr:Na+/H+ antiporter subunit G [Gammaproteobacteria bacterium]